MEEPEIKIEKKTNFEDLFTGLFEQTSGTGDEELLRIASTYSRQLSGIQMKGVLLIYWMAFYLKLIGYQERADQLEEFVEKWLELKKYNNSDIFVMRALEYISLKRFLGENSIKVNVEK